jgi:hypothetical protein
MKGITMRRDEVFLLGAIAGAVVVWWWGPKLEDRIERETRRVRAKAADRIQAVEATIRPA